MAQTVTVDHLSQNKWKTEMYTTLLFFERDCDYGEWVIGLLQLWCLVIIIFIYVNVITWENRTAMKSVMVKTEDTADDFDEGQYNIIQSLSLD